MVLTGDYESWVGRWEPSELAPGQPLRQPSPLFTKLDAEAVVESELARMTDELNGDSEADAVVT